MHSYLKHRTFGEFWNQKNNFKKDSLTYGQVLLNIQTKVVIVNQSYR